MFLQSFDKSFVLPILAMFIYVKMSTNRFMKTFYVNLEIEDTIKISKSTLTLTLLDLGYKYKKSGDN
jgi:hypothetical protein